VLLHEQAAEQALRAGDLAREARERNLAVKQHEGAERERRSEARAIDALAALDT
jgi:hypothetical protein